MRCLVISVLVFIASSCFAIDQKLIDGAEQYKSAVENLEKIEIELSVARNSFKRWTKNLNASKKSPFNSLDRENFYQGQIEEINKRIQALDIEHAEAKEVIAKLRLIKEEYDRQAEIEFRRSKLKTAILNISGMLGLPLAFIMVGIFFAIRFMRRNMQLLKEGKITQEEYNKLMQKSKSSMLDDERTNPATGLTMKGGCDSSGNPAGCSRDSSTFDYSQDYRDRHRWD